MRERQMEGKKEKRTGEVQTQMTNLTGWKIRLSLKIGSGWEEEEEEGTGKIGGTKKN